MLKRILVAGIFAFCSPAFAFDPVTIAEGLKAANGLLGGLHKVDDLAGLGFSIAGLMDDLGVDSESSEDLDNVVAELDKAATVSQEASDMGDEIKFNLKRDIRTTKDLRGRIESLRRLIDMCKTIAALMRWRSSAAQKVGQIQELRINSMILEELQAM